MIKVIIIDDHQLFIDGLIHSFNDDSEIKICGSALDGFSGLVIVKANLPDVVILDIDFSKTNESGIDIMKAIKQYSPDIKVLILTGYCDHGLINMLKKEGADGYRVKNIDVTELRQTILDVHLGHIVFKYESGLLKNEHIWQIQIPNLLSERAVEIIKLLSEGFIVKEIAQQLNIAESTVNDHLERAKRKLNAKNNCELVSIAGKNKLI
jgi:DNA-binding NarL/FixJ family response regulator